MENPLTASEILATLRSELKATLIERDEVIDGCLLALLTRQHVLLLGPPGTAKSMLTRELCRRLDGNYFEWLLTKFTTPEELFGPVSLPALEEGRYERITTHKLPQAEVAFLDEIFKSNSAILNALLTLLNERTFYHGDSAERVPLETLIGASNELPDEDELSALYDRFILRFTVDYVQDDQRFKAMMTLDNQADLPVTTLPKEALETLRTACDGVKVDRSIIAELTELRRTLNSKGVIASDRRYRQSLAVLKAAAFMDDRAVVDHRDLTWLEHILWTEPQARTTVLQTLSELNAGLDEEVRKLVRQAKEIGKYARRSWPSRAEGDRALLEAHSKLGEIQRRLDALQEEARERGRDAAKLEHDKQTVSEVQRDLLASEGTWQS